MQPGFKPDEPVCCCCCCCCRFRVLSYAVKASKKARKTAAIWLERPERVLNNSGLLQLVFNGKSKFSPVKVA